MNTGLSRATPFGVYHAALAPRELVPQYVTMLGGPREMRALLALGVDGLITDYPARALAAAVAPR